MSGEEVTADTEAPGAKEAREPVIRLLACPVTRESTTLFTATRLELEATLATEDSALTMLLPAAPETLIWPVATEASTFRTEACAVVELKFMDAETESMIAAALSVEAEERVALLPATTAVMLESTALPAALDRLAELEVTEARTFKTLPCTLVSVRLTLVVTASITAAALSVLAADSVLDDPVTAAIVESSDAPAALERLAELEATPASADSADDCTAVEMLADAETTAKTSDAVVDTAAEETVVFPGAITRLLRRPVCAATRSLVDRFASWDVTAADAAVALTAEMFTGA